PTPPPPPPLSPYTTLFRSDENAGVLLRNPVRSPTILTFRPIVERRIGENEVGLDGSVLVVEVRVPQMDVPVEPVNKEIHPAQPIDRKSTRLNSSHQIISYA